jgi:hypothetical protein
LKPEIIAIGNIDSDGFERDRIGFNPTSIACISKNVLAVNSGCQIASSKSIRLDRIDPLSAKYKLLPTRSL